MIRKSLKEEKAITLVALIITIIVLLILAMVSISLVMNGGIIDKSKSAVDKYSEEEIGEQLKLAYSEYQMSQYTDTPLDIQAKLQEIFGNDNVQDVSVANGKISAKIKVNGEFKTYEYDASTGKSTEIKPQALSTLTKDNYGDYIDLGQSVIGTESTADDWRILYNDKENNVVYAILADYLPNNNVAVAASGLNVVNGKTYNVSCTTYGFDFLSKLNSTTAWQSLISERLNTSCQVKGASTGETLISSYNEKYETNLAYTGEPYLRTDPNDSSSAIDTLYMPHPGEAGYDSCFGYWLATYSVKNSDQILYVDCRGRMYFNGFRYTSCCVRPVVSIPSNIKVISTTSNGVTVWSLAQ